jgi:hypothetical protein
LRQKEANFILKLSMRYITLDINKSNGVPNHFIKKNNNVTFCMGGEWA